MLCELNLEKSYSKWWQGHKLKPFLFSQDWQTLDIGCQELSLIKILEMTFRRFCKVSSKSFFKFKTSQFWMIKVASCGISNTDSFGVNKFEESDFSLIESEKNFGLNFSLKKRRFKCRRISTWKVSESERFLDKTWPRSKNNCGRPDLKTQNFFSFLSCSTKTSL